MFSSFQEELVCFNRDAADLIRQYADGVRVHPSALAFMLRWSTRLESHADNVGVRERIRELRGKLQRIETHD